MPGKRHVSRSSGRIFREIHERNTYETGKDRKDPGHGSPAEPYYRSPLWRSDFEADEAGKLPADLPRGVLSEDGIYNALQAYDDRQSTLSQCEEPRTETQKSVKDNKESGHMSCQAADF